MNNSIKRNAVIEVQSYIAEMIRERYSDIVNTHGLGFAYAANLILAEALDLGAPKSAKEQMSERQKMRWQSAREMQEEKARKLAEKSERRKKAREAKKAEASET